VPLKDYLFLDEFVDLKYSIDGETWKDLSRGTNSDIEVQAESIPDCYYISACFSCRILFSNNDRKMHSKPLRRGIVNKEFKMRWKELIEEYYK